MAGVVVLGSLNVDFVFRTPRLPAPGETVMGEDLAIFAGGKGANQAVAAARMGVPTSMIGAVGDDTNGEWMLAGMVKEGIDVSQIRRVERPTGAAGIFVGGDGANEIVVSPGANAAVDPGSMRIPDDCSVALTQHEVSIEAVDTFLELAERSGVRYRILNPAPARPLTEGEAAYANVIVPNESEAALLTDNASDPADTLLEMGFEHVIVTLGAAGVLYARQGERKRFEAPKVEAIDTTAAGDVFCGVLAAMLAEGKAMEEAIALAIRAASISVTRPGAQASAPFRREIL